MKPHCIKINNPANYFILAAAISGFLSVALGAFGAHGLKDIYSEYQLNIFNTGVQYQMYHSLAIFGVGILALRWENSSALIISGHLFIVGIVFFSGSLYLLSYSGVRWLGAITPIGGIVFLSGWAMLAYAAKRHGS